MHTNVQPARGIDLLSSEKKGVGAQTKYHLFLLKKSLLSHFADHVLLTLKKDSFTLLPQGHQDNKIQINIDNPLKGWMSPKASPLGLDKY